MKEKTSPLVSDVRGFSLDDGPGIRTTVFLKGCPLSCAWCQNPESWSPDPEIAYYPDLCIGCGECASVCPERAVDASIVGQVDRNKCTACGSCVEACPTTALKIVGKYYQPDELVQLVLKNRFFHETSGGGVTFSGGEPMLYMEYLSLVLRELKGHDVHVTIQTSGTFDMSVFSKAILPYVNLVLFDLKIFDAEKHKRYTGAGNEEILTNFLSLLAAGVQVVPRIPLVPHITATEENIRRIVAFVRDAGCRGVDLLPYNPAGRLKRRPLGKPENPDLALSFMTAEEQKRWNSFAREHLNTTHSPP